jgi:hypothetical protein
MNPLTLLYSVTTLAAVPSVPGHVPARPATVDSVPAAPVPADSVLTVDGVTRMTTFWKSLSNEEQQLIKNTIVSSSFPRCHRKFGWIEPGIVAASHSNPNLLAALKDAGLSAQQYELYQHLFESAYTTQYDMVKASQWSIGDRIICHVTKVEQVNMNFLNAHLSELTALAPGLLTAPIYARFIKMTQRDF